MPKTQNSKRFGHLKIPLLNFISDFGIRISSLLFYAIILLLPIQLGKHFWPEFAFVSGLRVDYLSPTLYLTDILIFLLFIFSFKRNIWPAFSQKTKIIIGAIALFLCVNIWFSQSALNSLYGLMKLLEIVFFAFYTRFFVSRQKDFSLLFLVLASGVLFESLLASGQFVLSSSIGGVLYFFGERSFTSETPGIANASLNGELVLRPYGTFPHPNVLAAYLVIAMTIISSKFNPPSGGQSSKLKKVFLISAVFMGSLALLLTMSRLAILLWIIFLTIFIVRNYVKKSKQLLVVLVIICSIGSILLLSPLRFRFFSLNNWSEAFFPRVELLGAAWEMIKTHSLLGVGLSAFLPVLPTVMQNNAQFLFSPQPVHNIFVLLATELGIIGLGIGIWFLWRTLVRVGSIRSTTAKTMCVMWLVTICVLGLGDHYFLTLQQGQLLLAFVFGYCWGVPLLAKKE